MQWRDSRRYLAPVAVAAIAQIVIVLIGACARGKSDSCSRHDTTTCYATTGCGVLCESALACYCAPASPCPTGPLDWTIITACGALLALAAGALMEIFGTSARVRWERL